MAYRETTARKVIAKRVRKARRSLLETQAEFAQHFGVQPLAVSRWERAEKVMRLAHQRTLYALEAGIAERKSKASGQILPT